MSYNLTEDNNDELTSQIDQAYQIILSNYLHALKQASNNEALESNMIASHLFARVIINLQLISSGKMSLDKLEALEALKKISFTSMDEYEVLTNQSTIYIKNTPADPQDVLIGKVSSISNGSIELIGKNTQGLASVVLSEEELRNNYIQFAEILENATRSDKESTYKTNHLLYKSVGSHIEFHFHFNNILAYARNIPNSIGFQSKEQLVSYLESAIEVYQKENGQSRK